MAASKCVMIVAGEASGDMHGARLLEALRQNEPELFCCGIGGEALRQAGMRCVVDASRLAVVGFTEVFARLPSLLHALCAAKGLLRSLRPDLLILIDFPEFNLHIARTAKRLEIPVLYYISPQIWAWRSGRVKTIKRLVDHMAVILPFETGFYREHDVPVTFVGHPLMDGQWPTETEILSKPSAVPFRVGLLPGSREKEVARHLPVMLEAAGLLQQRLSQVRFALARAPGVDRADYDQILEGHGPRQPLELEAVNVQKMLASCDVVLAASGTVTLEAAIAGMPMVIIYKLSPLTYWLGRLLIRVHHIGLVNLIAGRSIVPELIQDQMSAENIADSLCQILQNPSGLTVLKKQLLNVRHQLGQGGASRRVAALASRMLRRKTSF